MKNIPTPHINAKEGDFAKTVLMAGDPLRAKFIAETFLKDAKLVTSVRNMLGYTGDYEGKQVSVMGSGMGVPSMGIYSYELFNFYDVENIIRIGSAGAISDKLNLRDLVFGMSISSNSTFPAQYNLPGTIAPTCDYSLLEKAVKYAKAAKINFSVGNLLCSDTFYDDSDSMKSWQKMGVLAVEMESVALYLNAQRANKRALSICTISDCPFKGLSLPSSERQTSFIDMMKVALNVAKEF